MSSKFSVAYTTVDEVMYTKGLPLNKSDKNEKYYYE